MGAGHGCEGMANEPGHGCGMMMGAGSQHDMCALSRRIHDAPTPQERQALIEQAMPGMTPAAREHHLQMMQQHCQ